MRGWGAVWLCRNIISSCLSRFCTQLEGAVLKRAVSRFRSALLGARRELLDHDAHAVVHVQRQIEE